MDVVGDGRRTVAAYREPVAPRAKRRVSGPADRRHRRDRGDGDSSPRSGSTLGARVFPGADRRVADSDRGATRALDHGTRLGRCAPRRVGARSERAQRALDDATRDGARRARAALEVAADSSRDRAFDEMGSVARGLDDGGVDRLPPRQRVRVGRRLSRSDRPGPRRDDDRRDSVLSGAAGHAAARRRPRRRRCAARRRPSRRPIRFHARAAHRRSRRTQGVQIHSAERHRSPGPSSLRHGTPASVRRGRPDADAGRGLAADRGNGPRARRHRAGHRAHVLRDRRLARHENEPATGGRARGRPRVRGAGSAQPVLELEPPLRPRRVLHGPGRTAHRKRGRAGDDERGGAARRAGGLPSRRTPHVALGRHRHHAGRRRPRSVSAARSLARRAHTASRRRRVALARVGSAALPRRRLGAALGRRRGCHRV